MPKVLIADKMSPAATQVFKQRGVDVDVITGLSKEELIKIIPEYDGLAVRSSTRPDARLSRKRQTSKSLAAPVSVSTISTSKPQQTAALLL